ncbi:hypothetical protein AGDE_10357 [Angomonas deanei]|uniref:AAA domain containing protein, putative n=1 Tax=Angomonas deanei TaxID=59799 RepID=A0A7G2C1H5_9TRYP|nr:hypothetical protein AGDE_10357 [Angomonas deanei]CAD2213154.1 AAA domain containing protein, putative [Angomonas deanei]|eukprot:EPY28638.1 hypothetical protein AGDE_10357 [Angomonas deanei]
MIESKQNTILFFIVSGLPGAGKTTVVENFCRRHTISHRTHVLCLDEYYKRQLEKMNTSEFSAVAWRAASEDLFQGTESLLQQCVAVPCRDDSFSLYHTVILVEDNFYYQSMRGRYYKLVRTCNVNRLATHPFVFFGEVRFNTPLEVCVQHNHRRLSDTPVPGQLYVPEHVLHTMAALFEDCIDLNGEGVVPPSGTVWWFDERHTQAWPLLSSSREIAPLSADTMADRLKEILVSPEMEEEREKVMERFQQYCDRRKVDAGKEEMRKNEERNTAAVNTAAHRFDLALRTTVKNFYPRSKER